MFLSNTTELGISLPSRKLGGRVRVAALKNGIERELTPFFSNLIVDNGLNLIGTTNTYLDYCFVGSSGVAPSVEQTSLVSLLASTNNRTAANSSVYSTPLSANSLITYTFPVGAVSGTIREIGIGPTSNSLFARTIPKDYTGNETEIVIFSDEQLIVQYQLFIDIPTSDRFQTISINGTSTTLTIRAASSTSPAVWAPYRSGSYATAGQAVVSGMQTSSGSHVYVTNGSIQSISSSPSGTSSNAASSVNSAYVSGSHKRESTTIWTDALGNLSGGISAMYISMAVSSGSGGNSFGAYQVGFSTPVPKVLGTSFYMIFDWSWGRA